MLAKAIEKIQELANEKERCQVEEKVLFPSRRQIDTLYNS